jgi:hypothetical protein
LFCFLLVPDFLRWPQQHLRCFQHELLA